MKETTAVARSTLTAESVTSALRPWLVLIIVCAGFSLHPLFRQVFWTRDYLPNIAQQAATNIILAVGMTFVILTGGIDLSVGSVMALCGVALGLVAKTNAPLIVALLAALGVGGACGLLNGLVIALGRVPAFVMTLGMLTAARSLTVYITNGNSVSALPMALAPFGEGWGLVLITLFVVVAATVLQVYTLPGRYIRAIGANEEATRFTGVNVSLYKIVAYLLSGLMAGIAAIVLTAKFQLADTNAGTGAELNAIAAVVIGGASLNGGRGSVISSLVGALTIAVLNAGLDLVKAPDTLKGVITGIIIVVVVMVDQIRKTAR
ncbi:MAG: ABC transporter permease [Abitibacteriaceae bacterium]|nr:ABC transporter permease [Abditibacteriaceae bacterium]